jgi:Fic family protein
MDGNGRTARLLMNAILLNKGYQIVSIRPELRAEYITAIRTTDMDSLPGEAPFYLFMASTTLSAQREALEILASGP